MNIKFQRAVDRFAGVALCRLFSLLARLGRRPGNTTPPRRILVVLLSEMGSLVLAQPMFARLKQLYPGASLHVLLFARNREMLELLDVVPKENVLTIEDCSLNRFGIGSLRALRAMRALRFDVVIDCELFARVGSIFSFLSGAPLRVGFHPHTQEGLYRGSFINRPVMYNPYRHLSEQFLTMVAAVESKTVPLGKQMAGPLAGAAALACFFGGGECSGPPRSSRPASPPSKTRVWRSSIPAAAFCPYAPGLLNTTSGSARVLLSDGHAVGVIGLKEHRGLGQAIVAHCREPHCIDLTGYTESVRHLLALFHRASLVVTNDGGPGQFAALTPVPTIILFGPETPVLYGSLAANACCLHLSLPCSPCLTAYNHRNSPCDGDNQCLKLITPEQVLAKAREMLRCRPDAGARRCQAAQT